MMPRASAAFFPISRRRPASRTLTMPSRVHSISEMYVAMSCPLRSVRRSVVRCVPEADGPLRRGVRRGADQAGNGRDDVLEPRLLGLLLLVHADESPGHEPAAGSPAPDLDRDAGAGGAARGGHPDPHWHLRARPER